MSSQTLDYGRPTTRQARRSRALVVAYVCGALPLITGVSIAGLFLLTYASILPMLGLITIGVGYLLVFVGAIAVLAHIFGTYYQYRSGRWWALLIGAIVLLWVNFPACVACQKVVRNWRFTVVNSSGAPVTGLTVTSAFTKTVGSISAGGSENFYGRPGSGPIAVTGTTPAGPANGSVDMYDEGFIGGQVTIIIGPGGNVTSSIRQ